MTERDKKTIIEEIEIEVENIEDYTDSIDVAQNDIRDLLEELRKG